jgi:GTP cyclohydrolase I
MKILKIGSSSEYLKCLCGENEFELIDDIRGDVWENPTNYVCLTTIYVCLNCQVERTYDELVGINSGSDMSSIIAELEQEAIAQEDNQGSIFDDFSLDIPLDPIHETVVDKPKYVQQPFNHPAVVQATRDLLIAIGENPDREGLVDTPKRVANAWREFIEYDAGKTNTAFGLPMPEQVDQMVVVRGMKVWSVCEHHLIPFWCRISIAYIAEKKVLGLSKFARIAHRFAHQLQVQERLVHQIAEQVKLFAETESVAVLAEGQHLCMLSRGIKTEGDMLSTALYGDFRHSGSARAEFYSLVNQRKD